MNILQALLHLGGGPAHAAIPLAKNGPAPEAPIHQSAPDITYNSNPHTNVPYSSHDLAVIKLLHGGVPQQQAGSVGQANRFNDAQEFPRLLQGGQFNPGAIPLQNSGFGGPGYSANLQPTSSFQPGELRVQSPQRPISLY